MTRAELRALLDRSSAAPWSHGVDEVDAEGRPCPDEEISGANGGAVAFVMPYANIRTEARHGRSFNHDDARLIAVARNHLGALLDQLDAAERVIEAAREDECCMSSECGGDHSKPLEAAIAEYDAMKGKL